KAWAENTALTDEANKRYETTEAKLKMASNAVRDAAIDYGSTFLPVVKALSEAVGGLAKGFADMPDGLQQVAATLGTVTGAAALLGGGFLLAIPKIAEFNAALTTMRSSELPGVARAAELTTNGVSRMGRGLGSLVSFLSGPWGLALVAGAAGIDVLQKSLDKLKATSSEYENALRNAKSPADLFAVSDKGTPISALQYAIKDADTFKEKLDIIANNPFLKGMDLATSQLDANLGRLGEQLGLLAAKDLPAAQNAFRVLADGYNLTDQEQKILLDRMPQLRDALLAQANTTGVQVEGLDDATKSTRLLELAQGDATAATQEADDAQKEYLKTLADGDSRFVSFGDALSTVQDKQRQWAEQTAADTEDSGDSWQDYYDGVSVNLADYITELQAQVDAQASWEQNMTLLAGRASQGVIAELAQLGPEGAPLVAELVNATDDQLAVLERAFGERSADGTAAFSSNLTNAAPVIRAAASQLGQGAAAEIAQKLADGTATVDQIMRDYKLTVEGYKPSIEVDTSAARAAIRELSVAATSLGGKYAIVPGMAEGGQLPGAPSHKDNMLIAAASGEFVTRTAVATQPRNLAWLEYMNAGGTMPPIKGYANGGYVDHRPQYLTSYVSPSTAAAPVARDQRPITQIINPTPGMSESEVGRIAGERMAFAMRSA
ncbi:phage tail tape measure protein, partial [uncultured Microbacterium sp.]|uniref:phage tail tape measure protein n=1 Tax=uncultured Microbacterium sp. TaxID=191216 RepID=UPI0025E290C5